MFAKSSHRRAAQITVNPGTELDIKSEFASAVKGGTMFSCVDDRTQSRQLRVKLFLHFHVFEQF
jgi:hypothetical protein